MCFTRNYQGDYINQFKASCESYVRGQTFFNEGVLQITLAKENLVGSCVPLLLRGIVVTEALGTTKPKIVITWPLKLCLLFFTVLHREEAELRLQK